MNQIKENLIEDDFNSLKDDNDNNSKIDNQSGNLELGNTDADDLNIKIKKIDNVNDLNEQKLKLISKVKHLLIIQLRKQLKNQLIFQRKN